MKDISNWFAATCLQFAQQENTSTSFRDAERQYFKDLRGKFLNLLGLRIKILLAEKGILLFESDH